MRNLSENRTHSTRELVCETNLLANHREPEQAPAITMMNCIARTFFLQRKTTHPLSFSFVFFLSFFITTPLITSLFLFLIFLYHSPPTIRRPVPTPLFVSYNNNFSLECSSSYLFLLTFSLFSFYFLLNFSDFQASTIHRLS